MSQKQSANQVEEGTPGKTVKSAWKAAGRPMPLREWSRLVAAGNVDGNRKAASTWLASKRHGGTDEQRSERRLRTRERFAANAARAAARRAKKANKGQSQQKKKGGPSDSR